MPTTIATRIPDALAEKIDRAITDDPDYMSQSEWLREWIRAHPDIDAGPIEPVRRLDTCRERGGPMSVASGVVGTDGGSRW